jgi:hypothetical protein
MNLKDLNDKLVYELELEEAKKKGKKSAASMDEPVSGAGDKMVAPGVLKKGGQLYPPSKVAYSNLVK